MLNLMLRASAASAAAAVLIGVWFWSRVPVSEAGSPGQPLRQTASLGDTLTEDGRIGKVTDVQGIVAIRPGLAQRWSPLVDRMILRPGDWVRTDLRGANAVSLQLVEQSVLVVGPGTLVELVSPRQIRIAEGELRVAPSAKQPLELVGPDGRKTIAAARQFYRVEKQKLLHVEKEPLWLRGYEGRTADESLGSLVAKVDGRDVPLTVGYHKVTVDIRDQIARTTVEESFVNRTGTTLEGVFYFPLPQNASIAGFGMWIGDELVEADVVEKQRAREIFETILRERRDPALLEWTGGNIFKARVFPIFPRSEKRITMTYTQVLPLCGNCYHYQYALQSEMLREHPLRKLEIDLKVSSAMALRSVASPTHLTRNSLTAHSAHVEFSAQEYAPAQDFEVVVEVGGRQSDVLLIPHRRGEDGYFMAQLMPPGGAGVSPAPQGRLRRELLPDSEPLELLILADTSASMDSAARRVQAEFLAALLNCLMPKDRLNLAVCDVECRWAFPSPVLADVKQVQRAQQFLAARTSLGWTDLDRAVQAALKQCGPKTQVIYVGDGIVTAGDADPVAFAKRLRRMAEGKPGTFHAVAVGSSFEPGVLGAIASLGGGSLCHLDGSHGPQAAARDLLAEITQPGLRDLKIEFRGMRTARVYPETLPNLPLGTQQVVLGRYLPEGRDQAGEVVVTGTQAGKPVRFSSKVSLKEGEEGNSFIPRLWARAHLDALLEQGASAAVRDEIIALSQQYHIITPYTSFLVLESDADRQRFNVTRRFPMRDGEKFFAEGRDQANWELVQQQIRRAEAWRLGLRSQVRKQLSGLGRDTQLIQSLPTWAASGGEVRMGFGGMGMGFGAMGGMGGAMGGGMGGMGGGMGGMGGAAEQAAGTKTDYGLGGQPGQAPFVASVIPAVDEGDATKGDANSFTADDEGMAGPAEDLELRDALETNAAQPGLGELPAGTSVEADPAVMAAPVWSLASRLRMAETSELLPFPGVPEPLPSVPEGSSLWPVEARSLVRRLLRTEVLAAAGNGLQIEVETKTFSPGWNELSGRSRLFALFSSSSWLSRFDGDDMQTTLAWCDAKRCGAVLEGFQLGSLQASTPRDLHTFPLDPSLANPSVADNQRPADLGIRTTTPLDQQYLGYSAQVRPQEKGLTRLVLRLDAVPSEQVHLLVDPAHAGVF